MPSVRRARPEGGVDRPAAEQHRRHRPQRRHVVGRAEQPVQLGRDQRGVRRVAPAREDRRVAGQQGPDDHLHARDVRRRQGQRPAPGPAEPAGRGAGRGHHGVAREHHPLRPARRARRLDQQRERSRGLEPATQRGHGGRGVGAGPQEIHATNANPGSRLAMARPRRPPSTTSDGVPAHLLESSGASCLRSVAVARRRASPDAARRGGAGAGRHRGRVPRGRGRLVEGAAGPGGLAGPAGRRQLRQRLLRRHPRHRRRPGRPGPAGRLGAGHAAGGQDRGVRRLRGRRGRRAGARGHDRVVAGRGRGGVDPRRLVLHRRQHAVRLSRAGRGDGLRLLRPGRGDRDDVRPDRDLAVGRAVRRGRDRRARLRDPGREQPARHPVGPRRSGKRTLAVVLGPGAHPRALRAAGPRRGRRRGRRRRRHDVVGAGRAAVPAEDGGARCGPCSAAPPAPRSSRSSSRPASASWPGRSSSPCRCSSPADTPRATLAACGS